MKDLSITAPWRSRPETPDQIACRLKALLELLRPITPHFERWYYCLSEDNVPELKQTENWLVGAIAAGVCTDDLGAPVPTFGYFSLMENLPEPDLSRDDFVWLDLHAGSTFMNGISLRDTHEMDWPPDLVAYPVVKQTVLAFSEAFEPLWSEAGPFCLWKDFPRQRYKQGPIMLPCWMIHLPPPLAQRVTPPSDLVSERYADGSLFLAATDETFDPENDVHVAAAHRLFAFIDPLQEKLPREQWRR